jgi:hypothetical protein
MLVGDQHLSFVEGTVRRSVGAALLEVSAARESNGGNAAHAQLLGKIGPVYVNAEALIANDFHLRGGDTQSERQGSLSLDVPVKLGRTLMPAHAEVHLTDRPDGSKTLQAASRLSVAFDRFDLGANMTYQKNYVPAGPAPPSQLSFGLLGSGRIGSVRIRGSADFDVGPTRRFKDAELSAYWSSSDQSDWEGDLAYDGVARRVRARVSHILRIDPMAIALTGEVDTHGDVAAGFNLNFSLDPRHGFTLSRRPLAQGGMVHATVYRDVNQNGLYDPGEPLEKGALITTGTRQAERKTDSSGSVTIGGLTAYVPLPVGVDVTSLDDPMLVPEKALQVVVPRPGIPAEVQIGLIGGGDIEGALIKSGELGFEGVDLELINSAGKVVGTARTDFDGFFLFDRVAYGSYTLRVNANSAAAAKISPDLHVRIEVSGKRPVARLGSIQPQPQPRIAAAGGAATGAP